MQSGLGEDIEVIKRPLVLAKNTVSAVAVADGLSVPSSVGKGSAALIMGAISASDDVVEIGEGIVNVAKNLQKKIFGDKNMYEIALDFSLENAKRDMKLFLESESFTSAKKSWDETAGIVCIPSTDEGDSEKWPKNKVCIQIKYDLAGAPTYLQIQFKSRFESAGFSMSLEDLERKFDVIKKNKLTYLADHKALIAEIGAIGEQMKQITPEEQMKLVAEYNKKWNGFLTMTFEVKSQMGDLYVKDNYNLFIWREEFTYTRESTKPSIFSASYHSRRVAQSNSLQNSSTIWQMPNRSTAVAAAVGAAGLAIAAVGIAYSFTK